MFKSTILYTVTAIATIFVILGLFAIVGCDEPELRTVHDLTESEYAFYSYAIHALYIKHQENLEHWARTDAEIRDAWGEYHKHRNELRRLLRLTGDDESPL